MEGWVLILRLCLELLVFPMFPYIVVAEAVAVEILVEMVVE
jgi:hypothetical protein